MPFAYITPVANLDNKMGYNNDYWAKYPKQTAQNRMPAPFVDGFGICSVGDV